MPIRWMQFQKLSQWRMTHNLVIRSCVFLLPNRLVVVREVPHRLWTLPAHEVRRPLPLPVWHIVYDDALMLFTPRSAPGLCKVSSDQHIWTIKRDLLRSLVVR